MLRTLGAEPVEVRKREELRDLDGLVIPGGESTAIARLVRLYGLEEAIRSFERPVFGTCAGMILLDRSHLGLVDVDVERNAYGRQVASFEADLRLANAIEKARSYSMPKDNIDRAIARGSGADADAEAFEQVVYEGYGPNGVAVIVEALTDNRNRTAADVRSAFSKYDGNLGGSGAVAWLFERRGVILVDAERADEDDLTLAAAEGGADDVELDGSSFRVTTGAESLSAVREAIEEAGMEVDSAELTMVPKTTVNLEDESAARKTLRLIDALEESDDVQEVYSNFDIPERVMEAVL